MFACTFEGDYFTLPHTIIDIIKHKLNVFVVPLLFEPDNMFQNARQEAER